MTILQGHKSWRIVCTVPLVRTPGLTIHYRQAGHGEQALVFVHGNYASSRWWAPQLERLPFSVRGFAPDLRGCGGQEGHTQSSNGVDGLSVRDLADDLKQFVDALHLKHPILVGHSLGGVIVTEYAVTYPDQVGGLVLVDSGPPDGLPLLFYAQMFAAPLQFWSRTVLRVSLRQLALTSPGTISEELVDDTLSTPPEQYSAFSEALVRWNVESALPGLNIPTLIIWGEEDNIIPPQVARRYLELLPRARLVMIPDAGHCPQLQRPDEFSRALRSFVTQRQKEIWAQAVRSGRVWSHLRRLVKH